MTDADLILIGNTTGHAPASPVGSSNLSLESTLNPASHLFGHASRVQSEYFADTETAIYVIGRPTHATHSGRALLRWICERVSRRELTPLRDLYGLFVIIIDDRRAGETTFISDALGIRPWFVGAHRGRLIAGNNVLKIASAGFSSGEVNYDAVAAWLKYNHPVSNETVLNGYRGLAPGTVSTYRADGTLVRSDAYGELDFGKHQGSIDEAVEESFHAVKESVKIQTQNLRDVNLPLSGGYDSRLVFAITSQMPSLTLHLSTLNTREYEAITAKNVAAALGHQVNLIPGKKRILDLFDDPFCLTPAGFITGRNLSSYIARNHRTMPLLSGYFGDCVMRGSILPTGAAFFAKDDSPSVDDITTAIDKRYTMHAHRLGLLRDSMRKRVVDRATRNMRRFAEAGVATGRPAIHSDMFCRHRLYFGNVVLQHADDVETIAPFANYHSMNCRVRYHHLCFGAENYPKLFEKFFPPLAKIPHSYYLSPRANNKARPKTAPTRHLRRWSAEVAAGLLLTDSLSGAKKKKIFSLLPAGLLGEAVFQDEITFIYKLMIFERTLQKHQIQFDWDAI